MGKSVGNLRNKQNNDTPPSSQWEYYDGEKMNKNDTSLTLEFNSLSPICQLVRVAGGSDVVERVGIWLGDYR